MRHHLVSYSINHKRSLSDFPFSEQNILQRIEKATHHYQYKPGAVVDNTDVLQALKDGIIRDAIIDTWENEPNINQELLNLIYIGTPHIAGYSADGKANATRMSLDALCRFFHIKADYRIAPPNPEPDYYRRQPGRSISANV